jgi:hypothetical protein
MINCNASYISIKLKAKIRKIGSGVAVMKDVEVATRLEQMSKTIVILVKKINSSFIVIKQKIMKEYLEIAMKAAKEMDASKKKLEFTKKCVNAFPIAKYAKIMKLVLNAERNGYYPQKRKVAMKLVLIA